MPITQLTPHVGDFPQIKAQDIMPATLKHNQRGWYVEYKCFNPLTMRSERVRENLNKLRRRMSPTEFQRFSRTYVCNINVRLAAGWSPFAAPTQTADSFKTIDQAFADYRSAKLGDYEKSTRTCYESLIRIFMAWLTSKSAGNCYISTITKPVALRFMDDRGKTLSNNGFNSDLKKYRSIFGWFQDRGYLTENPFADIKSKKKQEKKRIPISIEVQKKVSEWCLQNRPGMLLVLYLIYNSLIRPKEICGLQVKHVNLEDHYILIPAEIAKTDKTRCAPLPEDVCAFLRSWQLQQYPTNYYLIGADYTPSRKPAYIGKYKKDWEALRKQLNIPEEMQLYSWKDTGITDMFRTGIDALTIMNAAGHTDLSTTTKYCQLDRDSMISEVINKAPVVGTKNPHVDSWGLES